MLLRLCLIFSLLLSWPVHAADKYYVAPAQFSAAFQILDRGLANIFGMFQESIGSFSINEDGSISNVRIAIDSRSLMLSNGANSRDVAALFNVTKYPEIIFRATAPSDVKDGHSEIKGTLTVHGISKPATFEATLNKLGNSRDSEDSGRPAAGLSLRGSFKRADFDMGDEPEMPSRFGETITLLLDIQAIKQ